MTAHCIGLLIKGRLLVHPEAESHSTRQRMTGHAPCNGQHGRYSTGIVVGPGSAAVFGLDVVMIMPAIECRARIVVRPHNDDLVRPARSRKLRNDVAHGLRRALKTPAIDMDQLRTGEVTSRGQLSLDRCRRTMQARRAVAIAFTNVLGKHLHVVPQLPRQCPNYCGMIQSRRRSTKMTDAA